jgi:hypothetical protein
MCQHLVFAQRVRAHQKATQETQAKARTLAHAGAHAHARATRLASTWESRERASSLSDLDRTGQTAANSVSVALNALCALFGVLGPACCTAGDLENRSFCLLGLRRAGARTTLSAPSCAAAEGTGVSAGAVSGTEGAAAGDEDPRRSSPWHEGATAAVGVPAAEGTLAPASCMMGSCANLVLLLPPVLCRFFRFLSFGLGVRHLKHADLDPNTSASHFGQVQSASGSAGLSIACAGLLFAAELSPVTLPSTADSRPVLPWANGAGAL